MKVAAARGRGRPPGAGGRGRGVSLPDERAAPPTPNARHMAWHSSEWDPENFDQQSPVQGDVVRMVVRDPKGVETPEIVCKIEHVDRTDHCGTAAIGRFIEAENPDMQYWGKEFLRGADDTMSGVLHFCRSWPCHAVNDDKTLAHCTRWKFVPPAPAFPPKPPATGVPLFGGRSKTPAMDMVDKLRDEHRDHGDDSSAGAGVPRGGGGRSSGSKKQPPLPPARRPNVGADDSGKKKDRRERSMNEVLMERAKKIRDSQLEDLADADRPSKKKKKKRSRRSSDESSGSSKSSVFRKAPSLFKGTALLRKAESSEGALLRNGIELMRRALATRQGGGDLDPGTETDLRHLQGVATSYLTTGLAPSAAAAGKPLGLRNEREMRTISEALDALLSGHLSKAGDILMQRFRACEVNLLEGDWGLAKHLEIIPQAQVTCVPQGMRADMIREQAQLKKLEGARR